MLLAAVTIPISLGEKLSPKQAVSLQFRDCFMLMFLCTIILPRFLPPNTWLLGCRGVQARDKRLLLSPGDIRPGKRAKGKGCTDLALCKEGTQSPLEQGLLGVTEEPQSPVSQHPSPQAVLRSPPAAPVALVLSQQPRCSAPAKPSPSCPDGEELLSIQWEKKNSRKPRAEHSREICPAPPPHAGRETRRGKVWLPGRQWSLGSAGDGGALPGPWLSTGLLTALGMGSAEGCSQGNTLPSTTGTPGGSQPTARTSRPPSSEPG